MTDVSTETSPETRSPSPADCAERDGMAGCARSLQAMAVFAAIVEAQSFTAAATVLGITPAAARKHISRLEARLGVKLLDRSPHGVALTAAGRVLHERCVRILRDAAEAHAALLAQRGPSDSLL
jgi:DNA-binding transcriptional LysR family regulator